MSSDYIPRFSFEISMEQKDRAASLIPQYGMRKAVFGRILDEVLDMVEQHGALVLGIIATNETKPREIIPSLNKAERMVKGE